MTTSNELGDGRIGRVLTWLSSHYGDQPTLEQMAQVAGVSPYHFQRKFTRNVGVSPKKFVQFMTLDHAKRSLADEASVLDAAYDAGLSGPGRLHDLFVTHEAMTPGEWKSAGAGLTLAYGWHDSPFGDCLIIAAPRGVCGLAFADKPSRDAALADLAGRLGEAQLVADRGATAPYADMAFGRASGDLPVLLRGTPFQLKVWEALLRIPSGAVVSYQQLANSLGMPNGARAVGGACGSNPVSWLIPCHRVLRASGLIGGYRWAPERKRVILAWEAARTGATREEAA